MRINKIFITYILILCVVFAQNKTASPTVTVPPTSKTTVANDTEIESNGELLEPESLDL